MGTDINNNSNASKQEEVKKVNILLSEISGFQVKKDELMKDIEILSNDVKTLESKREIMEKDFEDSAKAHTFAINASLEKFAAREKAVKDKEAECDAVCTHVLNAVTERENAVKVREDEVIGKENTCIYQERRSKELTRESDRIFQEAVTKHAEANSALSSAKQIVLNAESIARENIAEAKRLEDRNVSMDAREGELKSQGKSIQILEDKFISLKKEYETKLMEIESRESQSVKDMDAANKKIDEAYRLISEAEALKKQNAEALINLESYRMELDLKEGKIRDLMKKREIKDADLK